MKYLYALLLVLFISMDVMAQSASKRLNTYVSSQGSVYFIRDKKLTELSPKLDKFEFDVTQVEGRDSATVNFTIVTDKAYDITAISLSNDQVKTVGSQVHLLYHDIKGKNFLIRTTSQLCYADLKKLYTSAIPVVYTISDAEGNQHTATYSPSQWKKEHSIFQQIFFLINQ